MAISLKAKKILSVLLAMVLMLQCIPLTAVFAVGETPESELQNFWNLLQDESETDIKIAYLGGSVTHGTGASDRDATSWRAILSQWFVDNFGPGTSYNKNITNINCAVGGSGSYFGSYRMYQDCEFDSDNPPDLFFVEFAVNDVYDGLISAESRAKHQMEVNYESIIRQAYAANPEVTIVTVFVTDCDRTYSYINTGSEDVDTYTVQRAIADHYGLPKLEVGRQLSERIKADYAAAGLTYASSDANNANSIWRQYVADGVHPTDKGYGVYADYMKAYFTEQLLGDNVAHTADTVSVDIDTVTSYCAQQGYGNLLKEHGRRISFKDAGFTQDDFNGWTLTTTDTESHLVDSNGYIRTSRANSSFAFTFTGTALGFFNYGMTTCGTLEWKITSTSNSEKTYSGTVSLVKNYPNEQPYPAEIITGLDNEEYLAEFILRTGTDGSYGHLRYIYINGDPESIEPAQYPDTVLGELPTVTADIGNNPSKFTPYRANGESTVKDDVTAYKITPTPNASDASNSINVDTSSMADFGNVTFPDYKYVGVTYYLDDNNSGKISKVMMQLDQLKGTSALVMNRVSGYQQEAAAITGKWVTQYFDFTEYATITGNDPTTVGLPLAQCRFYPFGDLAANTLTSGEVSYVQSYSFLAGAPKLYNADGTSSMINDGTQIAYVSEDGVAYYGGKAYDAYVTISDAMQALAPVGGTIRVYGTATWVDAESYRGPVTIEGADSTAYIDNIYIIAKSGDTTFRNIKINAYDQEKYSQAEGGYTLTIGEGVTFDSGNHLRLGVTRESTDKIGQHVNVYAGTYQDFGAVNQWGGGLTVNGNTVFNFYGGTFKDLRGFSRDASEATTTPNVVKGDVYYNMYGGSYSGSYITSHCAGTLNGNLWYNVSGGTFAANAAGFAFGTVKTPKSSAVTINGSQIILINNKAIKDNGGTLSGVAIGLAINAELTVNVGHKFVIINNSELSTDTGAAISSGAVGDYQLLVNGGATMPVFDNDKNLKGFKIIADSDVYLNYDVYLDGVKITPNAEGLYVIEKQTGVTRTITFENKDDSKPTEVYVSTTGAIDGVDGEIFTSVKAAIEYLGEDGGIINVSGTATFEDIDTARGAIIIQGYGASPRLDNEELYVKSGDATFRNINIQGKAEGYSQVNGGYTLTIGEGVTVDSGKYLRFGVSSKSDKVGQHVNVYSGSYKEFGAVNQYGGGQTVTGDTVFNFYGGTISELRGIGRDGNKNTTNPSVVKGDVYFNLYGGSYSGSYLTAHITGTLKGNLWYTVNGGKFAENTVGFAFGNTYSSKGITLNGSEIMMFNNKSIKANGGTLSGVAIGKAYNGTLTVNGGYKFIIVNNSELSADTGVAISSGAVGDYQLLVNGGSAIPVFDGTTFKGFKITADRDVYFDYDVFLDGKKLEPNAEGLYEIAKDTGVTRTITFGNKRVYVSASGTINGIDGDVFTSVKAAIEYLGVDGGTINVSGTATFEDITTKRGAIIIQGYGASPRLTNEELLVRSGDATFRNINIQGKAEGFSQVNGGYTLTIGEGVTVDSGKYLRFGVSSKSDKVGQHVNVYSGSYKEFGAVNQYGGGQTVTGDTVFNFYGGTISELRGIGRDGNKNTTNPSVVKGDVYFNLYGGSYSGSYLTAHITGKLEGNLWYTVNGGTFTKNDVGFAFGNIYGQNSKVITLNGSEIMMFNNKNIKTNGGTLSGVAIGKTYGNGATDNFDISGYKFIIVNNSELSADTGVAISSGAVGDYQLLVNGGSAIPVFDGTTFKGFRITSDSADTNVYLDGVKITPNAEGLYMFEKQTGVTRDITFGENFVFIGGKAVEIADDYTVTVKTAGTVDFTAYPAPEKENAIFLGWYAGNEAVANGATLAANTVIKAKFFENYTLEVENAEIRTSDKAFRFISKLDLGLKQAILDLDGNGGSLAPEGGIEDFDGYEYGMLMIPVFLLGDKELTMDLVDSTSPATSAAKVPARMLYEYDEAGNCIRFTVCLTNLGEDFYSEDFAVVPYLTYTDAQGIEHTVYGEQYVANMKAVAELALSANAADYSEEEKAVLREIIG